MSLRDSNGNNAFAVKSDELQGGREGAPYDELKYISQTAEYFLAGVLDGLTDGKFPYLMGQSDAKAILVMPTVSKHLPRSVLLGIMGPISLYPPSIVTNGLLAGRLSGPQMP